MFDLKGKTAIVTGGNRGIGKVTCLKLAEMGANVAINHRAGSIADAEQVKAACEAFGVYPHPVLSYSECCLPNKQRT